MRRRVAGAVQIQCRAENGRAELYANQADADFDTGGVVCVYINITACIFRLLVAISAFVPSNHPPRAGRRTKGWMGLCSELSSIQY